MQKNRPEIDLTRCAVCRICVQTCPLSCLEMTREGRQGKYRNLFPQLVSDGCIGCGLCAKACPLGCISMQEVDG